MKTPVGTNLSRETQVALILDGLLREYDSATQAVDDAMELHPELPSYIEHAKGVRLGLRQAIAVAAGSIGLYEFGDEAIREWVAETLR